jgi:predicted membrane protein
MSDSQNSKIGFGIALIFFGAIFLLDNLGVVRFNLHHYVFSWEGIMIIIGTILLATRPDKSTGLILIAIGVFFILPDIFHMPYIRWNIFWPVILIVIGFVYILRQRKHHAPIGQIPDGSMDFIDDTTIFGGGEVMVTSDNFKGGRITSIFGGSNYNLTNAKLSKETNVIDFFAMFGGGTFIVPTDWDVNVDVTSVFGGFSDKRVPTKKTGVGNNKQLFIKGLVLFGGGEIKSF